jgi:hypothetical protein
MTGICGKELLKRSGPDVERSFFFERAKYKGLTQTPTAFLTKV